MCIRDSHYRGGTYINTFFKMRQKYLSFRSFITVDTNLESGHLHLIKCIMLNTGPVSYTHLDVYKRQALNDTERRIFFGYAAAAGDCKGYHP